jgi:hypothetical protein
MNKKKSGRKRSWPDRDNISAYARRGWGKPQKPSVWILCALGEIRMEHLRNISLESYHYTNLPSSTMMEALLRVSSSGMWCRVVCWVATCLLAGFAEIISSTLKMEAICSSETSFAPQQTTRCHIPEDDTLYNHRCGNLISHKALLNYLRLFKGLNVWLHYWRLWCDTVQPGRRSYTFLRKILLRNRRANQEANSELSWRWSQYISPKRRYTSTRLHCVISQRIVLFTVTAVRTSNLSIQ